MSSLLYRVTLVLIFWESFVSIILEFLNFCGFPLLTTGQYTSNIPSRPDVLAAMFFAAGMAFQRQVDSGNRLRMDKGAEDPLLPGENRRLLLEDVSPTFRSEASTSTVVQEV